MKTDIGVLPKPVPFGKYCLLEKISVGGMAEVFKAKAFGAEGFERLLAVKRILNSIAEDETFISMFIDEAKIAGQLNHPNIAQIFDLGKVDGSYFIALEYVSGKDLRTIWDRMVRESAKPEIFLAVYVAMKACAALHYAHTKADAAGNSLCIVHRDVSPHNILISYEGDAKIIDFGIAKAQGKTSETQVGILKGKFSYMSPEQVRGLHVDHRADIFSLGIVLYEMLTLERLFLGESDFDTLEKIRKVEMAPPTLYNPHIPRELEDIVLKSLAKSADDRFQTSSEMYDALDRFMRNQGSYFQAKELAGIMKTLFADEIEMERKKLDHYRSINIDTLNSNFGEGWDEDELDTKVFGRGSALHSALSNYETISPAADTVASSGHPQNPAHGEPSLGDGPLPDIVYKDGGPAVTADMLDVVELAAGFDELDDPTMEFNRDAHMAALGMDLDNATEALPPEPPPPPRAPIAPPVAPKAAPFAAPPASPNSGRSTLVIPSNPPPREKRSGVVIALLVVLILLLVGSIVLVLFAPQIIPGMGKDDAAITFKVANVETVKITVDDKVVYSGGAKQDIVVPKVAPGKRSIAVSADGYLTRADSLVVEEGQKYVLPIELEKQPAAVSKSGVSVSVQPSDAIVKVDGTSISEPTPFRHELAPGSYDVTFSKPGFLQEVRKVTIKPGEFLQLDVSLKPSQIALNIRADPPTASLTILELEKPEDTKGPSVGTGKGTLDVSGLDATKYFRIIAEAPGHKPYSETVIPGSEASKSFVAKLVPDPTADKTKSGTGADNLAKPEEERRKREAARAERAKLEEERRKKAKADAIAKAERDKSGKIDKGKPDKTKKPEETPKVAKGPGYLNINSRPAAQVLINGANVGWTPVLGHKVNAGSYSIVLVNDKEGLRKSYRVTVKAGQTKSVLNLK